MTIPRVVVVVVVLIVLLLTDLSMHRYHDTTLAFITAHYAGE